MVFLSMTIHYHGAWNEISKQTYSEESVKVHVYLYMILHCPEYTQHKSLSAKIDIREKKEWKFNGIEKTIAVWCGKSSISISI